MIKFFSCYTFLESNCHRNWNCFQLPRQSWNLWWHPSNTSYTHTCSVCETLVILFNHVQLPLAANSWQSDCRCLWKEYARRAERLDRQTKVSSWSRVDGWGSESGICQWRGRQAIWFSMELQHRWCIFWDDLPPFIFDLVKIYGWEVKGLALVQTAYHKRHEVLELLNVTVPIGFLRYANFLSLPRLVLPLSVPFVLMITLSFHGMYSHMSLVISPSHICTCI